MPRYRGTTTQRGLGSPHQRERKRQYALLIPGRTICWRCGQPMWPHQQLDLDHVEPRALNPGKPPRPGTTRLTHRRCNRSAGSVLGNKLRAIRRRDYANQPQPSPSRTW